MARKKSALFPLLGGSGRKKSKGLFGTLLASQRKTEKRNNSHRGLMCGPGGSKRKK